MVRVRGAGGDESRAAGVDQHGGQGALRRRARRVHRRRDRRTGPRVARLARELAVLRRTDERRSRHRRRAAHHDGALVASRDPLHGGVRRLHAGRLSVPAAHVHRRAEVRLPVDARGVSGPREGDLLQSRVPDLARPVDLRADDAARPVVRVHVAAARRGTRAGMGREVGGEPSRAHASRLRQRAARAPLDALAPGEARRVHGAALRDGLVRAVVGPVDGALAPFPEHALQLVVLHGRLALRAHDVRAARDGVGRAPRHGGRVDPGSPLPRHRQALLRVHRVLGLPHVRPVPRDLVRQHGRRDVSSCACGSFRRGNG